MRKVQVALLVMAAFVVLLPDSASARIFRRGSRSYSYARTTYRVPVPETTVAQASHQTNAETPDATAEESGAAATEVSPASQAAYFDVSTAQGVANLMAYYNRVGHFGGNPGYEGCGSGPTPQAAYNICCYANSGMQTVDVGYAQGSNGMWYCCRRYR